MADLIASLAAASGVGAGVETDPNFNQTVLLLHGDGTDGAQNNTFLDSSTNNFTITRNGNTTQGTFSPFSAPDGRWSNYFDGTDDYLSVADNAVLRPGAGAFTLEAWVYRNAAGAAHTIYAKGGASTGINFQITSGNALRFTHTTTNIDSTGTVAANAWVHVAVVREGTGANQTKLYINGTQDGQGTVSTDFTQTEEVRIGTNRSAGDDFAGYISNVRFVKGSALYTGNFTPSTSPFTTTSQGASSSEVELLTCQSNRFKDNSSNAFAITPAGNVKVTPFSPFAPTAAYDASVNGGSGYFDGSGDYLSLANNAAFDLSSSDFTISFWLYPTSSSFTRLIVYSQNTVNNSDYAFAIDKIGTNKINFGSASGNTWTSTSSSNTVQLNAWNFIVVTRVVTTATIYVNDVSTAVSAYSPFNNPASSTLTIGADRNGTDPLIGYLSNFRIVKGSALTPSGIPTDPVTEVSGTSLLCNFTNAGIFDNTGKNNLETVGNAQIDTTVKKYGTGSMEFDGTGDYLSLVTNPHFAIWNGANWTIEFFIYLNSLASSFYFLGIGNRASTTTRLMLSINTSGNLQIDWDGTSSDTTTIFTAGLSTSTWYHVAVVGSSGSAKVYVDGVAAAQNPTIGTATQTNAPLFIGVPGLAANPASYNGLNGFIDDLRITKGVARYTTTFSVPTKAFPDL